MSISPNNKYRRALYLKTTPMPTNHYKLVKRANLIPVIRSKEHERLFSEQAMKNLTNTNRLVTIKKTNG